MMGCAPTLFTCVLPFLAGSNMSFAFGLVWMLMILRGLPVWGLLLVIVGGDLGVPDILLRPRPKAATVWSSRTCLTAAGNAGSSTKNVIRTVRAGSSYRSDGMVCQHGRRR